MAVQKPALLHLRSAVLGKGLFDPTTQVPFEFKTSFHLNLKQEKQKGTNWENPKNVPHIGDPWGIGACLYLMIS